MAYRINQLIFYLLFCCLLLTVGCKKKKETKKRSWHSAKLITVYHDSSVNNMYYTSVLSFDSIVGRDTSFAVEGAGSSAVTFGNLTLPLEYTDGNIRYYYKQTDLNTYASMHYYSSQDSAIIFIGYNLTYSPEKYRNETQYATY